MRAKRHTWSPERQMQRVRAGEDGRRDWAESEQDTSVRMLRMCVMFWGFWGGFKRMNTFKECFWTWPCVSCSGVEAANTLKREGKAFFIYFFRVCASFSALSHGHKGDSDKPFISLTSCRLREDRWLLPRLFMALLISPAQSRASPPPNLSPLSLAISFPLSPSLARPLSRHFSASFFSASVTLARFHHYEYWWLPV